MHKVFEYILEVIGWLQIVASPLLLSLGIGAVIYFPNPTTTRLVIAIAIVIFGLLVGIIWATKVWKSKGTMWYISQVSATPELDNLEKTNKNE